MWRGKEGSADCRWTSINKSTPKSSNSPSRFVIQSADPAFPCCQGCDWVLNFAGCDRATPQTTCPPAGVAPTSATILDPSCSATLLAASAVTKTVPPATNPSTGVASMPAFLPAQPCSGTSPSAPVASQVAPLASNNLADVALPKAVGPVDPAKRSWADVVRGSAEVFSSPIQETCKVTCTKRIPIPSHEGGAHQRQQQIGDSERSHAFKRWARGRCYRCLAHGHQVRFCKAPFRCIRCLGPGHRERHCCFQSSSLSPHVLPYQDHQVPLSVTNQKQMQAPWNLNNSGTNWPDHAAMHHSSVEAASESAPQDIKGVVSTLLKSLRSELVHLFEDQLEMVLRPMREEMSAIKLWLARVANHFENQKQDQDKECLPTLKLGELFGPYSPIRLSSTSSLLETLAAERTYVEPLGGEEACVEITNSSMDLIPMEQTMQKEQKSIQVVDQDENLVPVEHASDDERSIVVEDPICTEGTMEESFAYVDQLMNGSSSPDVMTVLSHKKKACGKPRTHRRSHKTRHNILKSLGLVTKNGKPDEGKLEEFADLLKELLPPSIL